MLQVKSKYKIGKRLGAAVFEKCQTPKFTLSEARSRKQRTGKRPRTLSDYGKQLIEKQKMRYTYGLSERQFSRYVREAMQASDPAHTLHKTLEMRIDSVVFRLGLASTRRAARQMVSHGHILVNGRRTTIPSHHVRVGDSVGVREGSRESALFTQISDEQKDRPLPAWLTFDMKTFTGSVKGEPQYDTADSQLDYVIVFEYYSRR